MGVALKDTEVFFEEEAEHSAIKQIIFDRFLNFLKANLSPETSIDRLNFCTQMLVTVIEQVGRAVAPLKLPRDGVDQWAQACADMIADYLGLP